MSHSPSHRATKQYDGSGGAEAFTLFENRTLAILEAKWGVPVKDVWHGKYKEGTEFFTDEKIAHCKAYLTNLDANKTESSNVNGALTMAC